jgi:hypothetical protein
MNRDQLPPATACRNPKCFGTAEATTVCRYCGTDKTAPPARTCPYRPGQACDEKCAGRGFCLDVA